MSVKRITIVSLSVLLLGAFIYFGAAEAVKTKDSNLNVPVVELKTPEQELDEKYNHVTNELDKASKQREADKLELERKEAERVKAEEEKLKAQQELQAKREKQSTLAKITNKIAGVQTANASAQYSTAQIQDMIRTQAASHGLSAERMLRVANCESTFNPNAVNRNYTAGGGNPSGLYQYLPETWNRIGGRSPYGVGAGASSRFDVVHNIKVTMWAFANGYDKEWACK